MHPDDLPMTDPTGVAWKLMKTQFEKHKSGQTPYAGLASFVLNPALRKMFPNCDVRAVCQPLVDGQHVHIRPVKGGVIYLPGPGRGIAEADALLKDAGIG